MDYQNYSVKSEEKKKYLENFNWLNLEWIKRHSFTIKKAWDNMNDILRKVKAKIGEQQSV